MQYMNAKNNYIVKTTGQGHARNEPEGSLEDRYNELVKKYSRLERDYLYAIEQRNRIFGKLEQYSTVRRQIRSLLLSLHTAVIGRIELMNKPVVVHRAPKLDISNISKLPTEQLLKSAEMYDNQYLRAKNIYFNVRYLFYLSILGGYRFMVFCVRLAVRTAKKSTAWVKGL